MSDLFEARSRLVGTLDSVRYQNEAGDFSVATIKSQQGRITVVGNLLGASPGERLQLQGEWQDNPKFGRQFKVREAVVLPPTTKKGIARYLSSGLVEGIGPVIAERLVEAFGERTLDVLEAERHRLLQVPGIGRVRQRRIAEAWDKARSVRKVMLILSSNGVSTHFAKRIYDQYGDDAVQIVSKHPYRLARDIFGIGFLSADRIAQSVGLAPNDPERIAAGLIWLLDEGAGQGHVYLPREALVERAVELLDVDEAQVTTCLNRVIFEGALVEERVGGRDEAVYSRLSHTTERDLAIRLAHLLNTEIDAISAAALTRETAAIERDLGIELEATQRRALQRLSGQALAVLTGGPGTGKTTIVRVFVRAMAAAGGRVLLAAPTGRAARRLSEATGRQASTIHRMLQFNFGERRFMRDENNPLEADLVIVDEASMLDQRLARGLVRALPSGCGLLLVGDADQLPSVGPGNVLHDILAVREVPAVRLTEVFRQAGRSAIVKNAHLIRVGSMPDTDRRKPTGDGDFFHVAVDDPETALERVVQAVCERIPKAFGLDPLVDVQVLAPMHRGVCGIQAINAALQEALNPKGKPIRGGEKELRVGDKVIQLRNNYRREVFNGMIGRVAGTDRESGEVVVLFGEQRVLYATQDLFELALAYCISIHKSQGSEYPAVVVPIMNQHYVMLQRNLLYTAVTRAKDLVLIVGQAHALRRAVRNADPMKRFTALSDRIRAVVGG